jgi:hypothetical protein
LVAAASPNDSSSPHEGRGDQVQCYYCDGGLKNWDPEDAPFEEHARWFGECGFLQMVKGRAYVDQVRSAKPPNGDYLMQEEYVNYEQINRAAAECSFEDQREARKSIKGGNGSEDSGFSSPQSSQDVSEESNSVVTGDEKILLENKRLKEERLCKVCLDRDVGVVFIPCGHFATCVVCATAFSTCPVCRTEIVSAVRTFLS